MISCGERWAYVNIMILSITSWHCRDAVREGLERTILQPSTFDQSDSVLREQSTGSNASEMDRIRTSHSISSWYNAPMPSSPSTVNHDNTSTVRASNATILRAESTEFYPSIFTSSTISQVHTLGEIDRNTSDGLSHWTESKVLKDNISAHSPKLMTNILA